MAKNNEQTQRRQLSMYDYFPEWAETFDESEIPEAVFAQEAAEDLLNQEYDENSNEYKTKLLDFALAVEFFAENKFRVQAHWKN